VRALLELMFDRDRYIGELDAPDIADVTHVACRTVRPLGPESFVDDPEQRMRRHLKRQKPGPKPPRRDLHTNDLFIVPERN
jgi:hypothetical protein